MNPGALVDALYQMSMAVLAAESGRFAAAETAVLEAGLSAGEAFLPRSLEADALHLVLGAVTGMALGRAA